jgi:thioredoxin-like negative regulator of GroEL
MILTIAAAFLLQADDTAGRWLTDYDEAVRQSEKLKRPLLIFSRRDVCPNCQVMESRIQPSEPIKSLLSKRFVAVRVDCDNLPEGANRFRGEIKGRTLPIITYVTPKGKFINGTSGFRNEEVFKADLEAVLASELLKEPKEEPKDAPKENPPPKPKVEEKPIADADLEPMFIKAKLSVAEHHIRLGKKEKAIEVLEEVIKTYPKSPLIPEAQRLLEVARKK